MNTINMKRRYEYNKYRNTNKYSMGMIVKEIKISLPFYKIFSVILLSERTEWNVFVFEFTEISQ